MENTQIILDRIGLNTGKDRALLGMKLGEYYINRFRFQEGDYLTRCLNKHLFSHIFEASDIAGESGVHLCISEINISEDPVGEFQDEHPVWLVGAKLIIGLKEYDKLRLRRSFHRGTEIRPFPPYARVEG